MAKLQLEAKIYKVRQSKLKNVFVRKRAVKMLYSTCLLGQHDKKILLIVATCQEGKAVIPLLTSLGSLGNTKTNTYNPICWILQKRQQ